MGTDVAAAAAAVDADRQDGVPCGLLRGRLVDPGVKLDSTWSWRLTTTSTGGTRLVTRIHVTYDRTHPITAVSA